MISCPACGKENEDSAAECRRCRAPLRDEPVVDEHAHEAHPHAAAAVEPAGVDGLGEVCRRCEAYNEAHADRCTNCGALLAQAARHQAPVHEAHEVHAALHTEPAHLAGPAAEEPLDRTPAHPYQPQGHRDLEDALAAAAAQPEPSMPLHDTPPEGNPSLTEELSGLALSPEEAAEAGRSGSDAHHDEHHDEPLDKTPPQAFELPHHEPEHHEPAGLVARGKAAVAGAAGVAVGAAAAAGAAVASAVSRKASEPAAHAEPAHLEPAPHAPPPAPAAEVAPARAAEQKPCASCGAMNPPAAKFCFDCGTPFPKKPAMSAPPPAAAAPVPVAPPPPAPVAPPPALVTPPAPVAKQQPPPPLRQPAPAQPEEIEAVASWEQEPLPAEPESHAEAAHPADATMETGPVTLDGHEHAPHVAHDEAAPLAAHDEAAHEHAPLAGHDEAAHEHAPLAGHELEHLPGHAEEPLPEELPADDRAHEPVAFDEPLPEELAPAEALPEEPAHAEELPAEEYQPELIEDAPAPEAEPPFHASLVAQGGAADGTSFVLAHVENSLGGAGAAIELAQDPFVAPHAATIAFAEDRLLVRDEGSANGVYVKVRESAPIQPGDCFAAGEHLLRFDGPVELQPPAEGGVPFLGAPRPQGPAVRLTELLSGGKTGRTCHRAGPVIAVGRSGCDVNFPGDPLLAARHVEIRLEEDGTATLIDLGQSASGVFVRVRAQEPVALAAGDVLLVGEQQLRVEIG